MSEVSYGYLKEAEDRIDALEQQLSTLRGLVHEALSNMEYYPASLGEYWLVQDRDITELSAAIIGAE